MPIRFRTETGSVYLVDNDAMRWQRLRTTLASGVLRSEGGPLSAPVVVEVGQAVVLLGPPFAPGLGPRVVITTAVTAVLPQAADHARSRTSH
jgi:hypothetical protein